MPAYKYILKDGKTTLWRAKFYAAGQNGRKKQICKRGFKTRQEAEAFERAFLEQEKNPRDILFSSLVENYMEDMSHRLKPTTMENKRFIINGKLLPFFGMLNICEIDAVLIRKWQDELISYRDETGAPFSQTYLKTVSQQLSAIMNYAVAHCLLPANPCRTAGSIGKNSSGEMHIWTPEQYEQFSGAIQKSSVKLAFDVLFYTGMRSGELLALTPADILPSKQISVSKTYARINGRDLFLEPENPKARRCISIPDFLYDDIQAYISDLHGTDREDRIFRLTKSALNKEIRRVAAKAGLPPISVRDLRHSHAGMLIGMGFTPPEIANRLGHASVKTTLDTYFHLYPDRDPQLAEQLNQFRKAVPTTEEFS